MHRIVVAVERVMYGSRLATTMSLAPPMPVADHAFEPFACPCHVLCREVSLRYATGTLDAAVQRQQHGEVVTQVAGEQEVLAHEVVPDRAPCVVACRRNATGTGCGTRHLPVSGRGSRSDSREPEW